MDSISSTLCTCATMTLITPSPHLFQVENYWMVECEGHWLLQDDLNKVSEQHITYHVLKFNPYIPCCQVQYSLPRPGRNKIELDPPVHDRMRKDVGVLPPKENFQIWCSEIASEAIFPFFSLICSSWQASTMPRLVCYATTWLHGTSIVYQARPSLTFQKSERRSSRCY